MSHKIIKEYCYYCRKQTNQEELLDTTSNHASTKICSSPEVWVSTYTLYKVRKCMGCEHVSLTRWQYDSDLDRQYDSPEPEYFPPRTFKEKPQWHWDLDQKYQDMLSEIYTSLANGTNRLSLMGCRTIVDMYLNDKVGDIGGFGKKLQKLYEENGISYENKDTLVAAIEAGNAASHRAYHPNEEVLFSVVGIIENLLEQMVLNKKATRVASETPNRS